MAEIDPEHVIAHYRQRCADLEYDLLKHQIALRESEKANAALQQALEESQPSELGRRLGVPDPTPEIDHG